MVSRELTAEADVADASGASDGEARLLERLRERGLVAEGGLERAERLRRAWGGTTVEALVKLGLVGERDLATAFSQTLGLPLIGEDDYPDEAVAPIGNGLRFLKDRRAAPVAAEDDGPVTVAFADPLDEAAADGARRLLRRPVRMAVGVPAEIEAALERLYAAADAGKGGAGDVAEVEALDGEDVERLRDLALEAPVIRLVNEIIARAVERRASDIHIEPVEGALRVRYRIDGVLQEMDRPPFSLRAAIVSRIKILARLDIAERRLPQDGRIRVAVRGKSIDLRVATAPSVHGESVVLRVLDHGSVELDLERLGFTPAPLKALTDALERPNTIVLVTGPTGSGKTTTLYAALRRLNGSDRKIITIEDPVEYQLDGVIQVQVQPEIDLTFARQLRANLRHDPDIMMVGEIRDLETVQIAMQAALTGHLVLSTLHTNGSAASISRLLDMRAEPYLLTATLGAICAQRLVRKLCPDCRRPAEHKPAIASVMGVDPAVVEAATPHTAIGCPKCAGSGYRGRMSIAEVLTVTPAIRALIAESASADAIHAQAVAEGMRPILRDGFDRVLAGETSLEEVIRVIGTG
jgi:general secretion pathway protein E